MKNKVKIILGLILILVIIIIGLQFNTEKDTQLTIGTIIPLSGNMAFIGDDFKKGLDLALINNPEISLHYEDNKGEVTSAVSAYQKLQSTVKPDVIISAGIADLAVIPLAEKDQTPLVLSVSSASGLPAMGENIFRYFTNADLDAPVMADYTVKELGLNKVGILYLQDQFGIDYKNVFTKEITRLGGQVVAEESFQYTDYDYRTQISKIKNTDFDSIYLIGLDYQLITAIKQIRELGVDKQIISIGTIATRDSIDKTGPSIEGVYVTAFCVDGMPESYVTAFQEKYGNYPGFFSELGYDIGKMIISASKKGDDRDAIRKGLSAIKNFPTNTGLVSADQYGEMVMPVCVKQITGGKIYNTVTGNYSDF